MCSKLIRVLNRSLLFTSKWRDGKKHFTQSAKVLSTWISFTLDFAVVVPSRTCCDCTNDGGTHSLCDLDITFCALSTMWELMTTCVSRRLNCLFRSCWMLETSKTSRAARFQIKSPSMINMTAEWKPHESHGNAGRGSQGYFWFVETNSTTRDIFTSSVHFLQKCLY